jgi:hypothetical protein
MPSQPQRSLFRDEIVVDARGPGEWIVGVQRAGHALHVYRIGPADWLVSEVGRANEGRGRDLRRALASLAAAVWPGEWWEAIAHALEVHDQAP